MNRPDTIMGSTPPFMYSYSTTANDLDARFPSKPFDPKAVTRASWDAPPPPKPKREGPLVSFNRHPDSLVVPEPRPQRKALGPRTKSCIIWLRYAQLGLRLLQTVAAAGILFLMIIIDDVSALTAWVMRVTAGVVMLHCAYAIFHLAHPAGARPPGSSMSYQTFASITDLAVLPLYTYGCLSVRNSSDHWGTLLNNESLMNYFLPALYYALFVAAILHLVTMSIGLWLALKFRQITRLPPDMNPLEDNLTARHQKKLSAMTASTYESDKRFSPPLQDPHRSAMPYDDVDRPPAVPFHATRSSPRSSIGSADFPPRQYQITPSNSPKGSPRNSATAADLKRMSAPPSSSSSSNVPVPPPRNPWRGSYTSYAEVPTDDLADFRPPYGHPPPSSSSPRTYGNFPRPGTGNSSPRQQQQQQNTRSPPTTGAHQARPAKFTEAWYATESLFNRTHERNRAMMNNNGAGSKTKEGGQAYEAVRRRYDSDSEYSDDDENTTTAGYSVMSPSAYELEDGDLGAQGSGHHPNPLRSNPSIPSIAGSNGKPAAAATTAIASGGRRLKTPFSRRKTSALSEVDLNDRRVSGGGGGDGDDIADQQPPATRKNSKRYTWAPRDRNSSIQPEADFYSKPYGDLKAGPLPVVVGADRQVSSGNDYGDLAGAGGGQAAKRYFSFGKRNVSGKVAEEGRGVGWAR